MQTVIDVLQKLADLNVDVATIVNALLAISGGFVIGKRKGTGAKDS